MFLELVNILVVGWLLAWLVFRVGSWLNSRTPEQAADLVEITGDLYQAASAMIFIVTILIILVALATIGEWQK